MGCGFDPRVLRFFPGEHQAIAKAFEKKASRSTHTWSDGPFLTDFKSESSYLKTAQGTQVTGSIAIQEHQKAGTNSPLFQ